MMRIALLALACALAAAASAAQLYRWVDDKGNVEWRDTPPPPHAKKVEIRNMGGNTIETSTLPYSQQQAIKNHPVTLWIFDCGEICDRARAHLARRGVPYTERNAQKDVEGLRKLTGGAEVPVLLVGTKQLKGYLDTDWDAALDSAGYLRSPIPGVKAPVTKPAAAAAKPDGDAAAKAPAGK